MEPIINVNGLGKRYTIGANVVGYQNLRDKFSGLLRKRDTARAQQFWALRHVNFNVYEGQRLAIIGRNGAGKSTLLKIMSRITPPTEGSITIQGRVASLLEVGTGFHGELTGRENVYLNGSILGLSKAEITRRFDEIVEFSNIEKFIDTPLRHYSSGMQLRLAFSVAAHLDPEVLIIDEVLAVGDADFQKKCINKMQEVSSTGRTLLFVSHNFAAIRSLCDSAILLSKGTKEAEGPVDDIIELYNSTRRSRGVDIDLDTQPRYGKVENRVRFAHLKMGQEQFASGEKLQFRVRFKRTDSSTEPLLRFYVSMNVIDKNNLCIYHITNYFLDKVEAYQNDETWYCFSCENDLPPGIYTLNLFCRTATGIQDWIVGEIQFEVLEGNPYNYPNTSEIQGAVFADYDFWTE